MMQRYLTRGCFALLLALIVLTNHGNIPINLGIADISIKWDLSNRLNGPMSLISKHY